MCGEAARRNKVVGMRRLAAAILAAAVVLLLAGAPPAYAEMGGTIVGKIPSTGVWAAPGWACGGYYIGPKPTPKYYYQGKQVSSAEYAVRQYEAAMRKLYGSKASTSAFKAYDLGSDVNVAQVGTLKYTGFGQKPSLRVVCAKNGQALSEGAYYNIAWYTGVDAGTATAHIVASPQAAGLFKGSKDVSYQILPADRSIKDAVVSAIPAAVVDGTEKCPMPDVMLDGKKLVCGADYTLSSTGTEQAGTATLTIEGVNYSGTKEVAFTMAELSVGELPAVPYTGLQYKPDPTVTFGGKKLVKNVDYTLSYGANVNVGVGSVTVTCKGGKRVGSQTFYFDILPAKSIEGASVGAIAACTHNGKPFTPKPVVTLGGKKLVEGIDYELSYADNVKPGEASVMIKGKNYSGTKTVHFKINKEAGNIAFSAKGSWNVSAWGLRSGAMNSTEHGTSPYGSFHWETYTTTNRYGDRTKHREWTRYTATSSLELTAESSSGAVSYSLVSGDSSMTLEDLSTPELTVAKGTPAGDYRAVVRATAAETWQYLPASKDVTVLVHVLPVDLYGAEQAREAAITLAETSMPYNGAEQRPAVSVTYAGEELVEGVDYTLAYSNNMKAGNASVKVTGQGAFSGSSTRAFTITKPSLADLAETDVSGLDDVAYTGKALTPAPVVTLGGRTLVPKVDYSLSYKNNVNAGTATVVLAGKGNYTGAKTLGFSIVASASIEDAQVTGVSDAVYNGKAKTPSPTVKLGGKTLKKGVDYDVSYLDNVELGQATVRITGKNYSGTKDVRFRITKKAGSLTASASNLSVREGALLAAPAMFEKAVKGTSKTGAVSFEKASGDARVSVDAATGTLTVAVGTPAGAYEYAVNVTAAESADYEAVTKTVKGKVTVVPLSKKVSQATIAGVPKSVVYTGQAHTFDVSVELDGRSLVEGRDYVLSYANNVKTGTATVKATGIAAAGFTGTKSATFKIEKPSLAALTDADVTGLSDMAYTGKALTPKPQVTYKGRTLALNTDYTLSYKNNVKVGTATVTVAGKGNYAGSKAFTFQIVSSSGIVAASAL